MYNLMDLLRMVAGQDNSERNYFKGVTLDAGDRNFLREALMQQRMAASLGMNPEEERRVSNRLNLLDSLYGSPGGPTTRMDELLVAPRRKGFGINW
mgnify:CR=1 FL=1